MDEFTREILTDETLIACRESWFQKIRDIYSGKDKEKMFLRVLGAETKNPELIYTDPEKWMDEALENLAVQAKNAASKQLFLPLAVENWIYGVHFVDKVFGAEVFFQYDQWYNHYLKNEVGKLEKPDLENNETWGLAKRIAQAFLNRKVTVPMIATQVIASALNIAVNLYGEEILVAMVTEPEAAHHDLQIINEVLMEMHRWYREHIPTNQLQPVAIGGRAQPPGHGQLCRCTTQLLSPALYEEFIMPLDNALLGVYPNGGLIHLCGSHKQLIPLFARMENLKNVQLNDKAAEDLEYYVEGLREDQVIYLNLCEGMPLERALEIAKDKRMIIIA